MSKNKNTIGQRGEAIFVTRLLTQHGLNALFQCANLGGKWEVADFVVELENKPGRFCLVQVKTTTKGRNNNGNLKVSVSRTRYGKLAKMSLPTYIVGVDSQTEDAYICAAKRQKTGLTSLKTQYSLKDQAVRKQLHSEVNKFWISAGKSNLNLALKRRWVSRLY